MSAAILGPCGLTSPAGTLYPRVWGHPCGGWQDTTALTTWQWVHEPPNPCQRSLHKGETPWTAKLREKIREGKEIPRWKEKQRRVIGTGSTAELWLQDDCSGRPPTSTQAPTGHLRGLIKTESWASSAPAAASALFPPQDSYSEGAAAPCNLRGHAETALSLLPLSLLPVWHQASMSSPPAPGPVPWFWKAPLLQSVAPRACSHPSTAAKEPLTCNTNPPA